MNLQPWWQRCPAWLEEELKALDAAGIRYHREEAAFAKGVAQLHLEVDMSGEIIRLVATFPDLYPYFRVDVQAPELDLAHHQNPFQKNLCLLPQRTEYWSPRGTLASLLREKLPLVLCAARSDDRNEVMGLEQEIAEPITEFYPYQWASMIIVEGSWSIDKHQGGGKLLIGTPEHVGIPPQGAIRGAILEVRSPKGELLAESEAGVRRAFAGSQLWGQWVRTNTEIRCENPAQFLMELFKRVPEARNAPTNQVVGGWIQIWGVIFPEEIGHREIGDGWAFVCGYERNVNALVRQTNALGKQKR